MSFTLSRRDFVGRDIAPQGLRNFKIYQVRGTKDFARLEYPADLCRRRGLEQDFEQRGSVNNSHRRFLSARMTSAGGDLG